MTKVLNGVKFNMFRVFFQILAITWFLGLTVLSSALNADMEEFSERKALKELVWQLCGFLDFPSERGLDEVRRVSVFENGGQSAIIVSMVFSDPLAAWPKSLTLTISESEFSQNPPLVINDAIPFGGRNLVGATPLELEEKLASINSLLKQRPKVETPIWRLLEPGLWEARVHTFFGLRLKEGELYLYRVDPALFDIKPFYENENSLWSDPANIRGWADRLDGASLLINSGQYYSDRRYMGLLKRDFLFLESRIHKAWKGFVVSDPVYGGPKIVDLETQNPGEPGPESYGTVIQSHMLFDRYGRIRVKNSDHLASRTVLGQDRAGFLWVVLVPGAVTLWDLAELLKELGIKEALGLDGGFEAQGAVRRNASWAWDFIMGSFSHNAFGNLKVDNFGPSLPSVLALVPKKNAPLQDSGDSFSTNP